jgi:glycosyltransferase involved in cell wall biosynthesis
MRTQNKTPPKVSIIVPCYNESKNIEKVLIALVNQSYPKDCYEIIVVDNNSTDGTYELAKTYHVKVLIEERPSSYLARNLGIRNAQYEWLAFIDGDCIPDQRWIENLVRVAIGENCYFVAGQTKYIASNDSLANRLLASRHTIEKCRMNVEKFHSVPGGNMLIHHQLFVKYGMFDAVKSGGDIGFSQKVARYGDRILYEESAIVSHNSDFTNAAFLKRAIKVKSGQQLLDSTKVTWLDVIYKLTRFPWQPGLRSVQAIADELEIYSIFKKTTLWGYLWLERFFQYIGTVQGAIEAARGNEK